MPTSIGLGNEGRKVRIIGQIKQLKETSLTLSTALVDIQVTVGPKKELLAKLTKDMMIEVKGEILKRNSIFLDEYIILNEDFNIELYNSSVEMMYQNKLIE